jgi:hypothetical protein
MTDPRNWDKELAEIDKLMASDRAASTPNVPAKAGEGASRAAPVAASRPSSGSVTTRPRDTLGIWLRALLGVLGAAALSIWPYNKGCGTPLYLYLAGVAAIAGMGIYTMRYSWTHRRGIAHMVGLLVLFAGLALAAAEILPRTGYAAVALTWTCP